MGSNVCAGAGLYLKVTSLCRMLDKRFSNSVSNLPPPFLKFHQDVHASCVTVIEIGLIDQGSSSHNTQLDQTSEGGGGWVSIQSYPELYTSPADYM
jgi:hypothetical protein